MGNWIPVSTQLPSLEGGFVLIVVNFHEPHVRRAVLFGYHDPMGDYWVSRTGRLRSHWEVTHWQPAPELPEEEGSDE